MPVKKLKTFSVSAELRLEVDVSIEAENLEDAVVKSKDLKVTDFVDFQSNGYIDGEHVIKGVWCPEHNFKKV